MKKAYLVTVSIMTRVVTEEEGDPNGNLVLSENIDAYNDIVSKACDNIYNMAPNFGEDVCEIEEDYECPYGTYPGEYL